MTIYLKNGDVVEMPKANFQTRDEGGSISYRSKEKEGEFIGTLSASGDFVSADSSNRYTRKAGDTIAELTRRLEAKDQFTWRENENMMKLKNLLTGYLPKSGRYK